VIHAGFELVEQVDCILFGHAEQTDLVLFELDAGRYSGKGFKRINLFQSGGNFRKSVSRYPIARRAR
jgi:hypothetical protein